MTQALLEEELGFNNYDLAVYLVGAARMADVNETHLQHDGPTDVITFDYSDKPAKPILSSKKTPAAEVSGCGIHGELFICIDVAISQAREFRTTWQSELIRYVIHGILHLCGYDDLTSAARKVMKNAENNLVKTITRKFPVGKLGGSTRRAKS
jgi:metalloprotein, YbeY/UPF0054 family